jgi:nucleoside-diphosphate-sugar epimerase
VTAVTTQPKTIVITGGAGFIGSAVAAALTGRGHRVVRVDTRDAEGVSTVDIRDDEALRRAFAGADVVIHGAAVVGVEIVRSRLAEATAVNVGGAVAVFAAARASGVSRVVDLSSEEVYGSSQTAEDVPAVPSSAYGVHKLAAELLSREFIELEYAAARLSWIYGPDFPRQRLPQPWIDDAAVGRDSHLAAGGDHVIDLLHITDAASAGVAICEAERLDHRAYNVGSGTGVTLREVADGISALRPSWRLELGPGPLPKIAQRAPLPIERIRDELGWTPELSLREGLRRSLPPHQVLADSPLTMATTLTAKGPTTS